MKIVECAQGTPEWFAARVGVITASRFKEATAKFSKKTGAKNIGDRKAEAENYAFKIAVERISGESTEDTFQSYSMRRGQELEADARFLYAEKTGQEVTETGVILTDCGNFGYSSDGLVGANGAIEIKSLISAKSILPVFSGDISEFFDQMQGGLMISEREWCDFVMFCPQLEKVNKSLYIRRVSRDEAYIKALKQELDDFNDFVYSLVNKLAA